MLFYFVSKCSVIMHHGMRKAFSVCKDKLHVVIQLAAARVDSFIIVGAIEGDREESPGLFFSCS